MAVLGIGAAGAAVGLGTAAVCQECAGDDKESRPEYVYVNGPPPNGAQQGPPPQGYYQQGAPPQGYYYYTAQGPPPPQGKAGEQPYYGYAPPAPTPSASDKQAEPAKQDP